MFKKGMLTVAQGTRAVVSSNMVSLNIFKYIRILLGDIFLLFFRGVGSSLGIPFYNFTIVVDGIGGEKGCQETC